ncbi:Pentatricopeptide repeat-containing protein [Zea mays]|uniref:Pentatricopeptide repeat-containing protein mitochondrial n=2 Tax=Zea mays TaxID=4577 RepID=A0A1D6P5W7_MAIZE|nr:pentatricopeptide repeat-containing protein At4g02750 [Zea mays]XP_020399830.1 pentatricopeptide repeat-containing protein At4g02750 [Zea mays]XP_020399831.1 pentatricopeptide repeat-containing protein At4g02750 [Zea mays]XP_020399832.1 pentatricopeptide repeat-containing protein At4g02750 [Zea mays]AQL05330.1 Pentatricopeptide repeat-containing protein mitochondrial [Zea mays]PWZ05418.1 Pentatricopeptide repeat-containing protein [Zea mays]|eukprot:XP_020399829.1 pentatricopeptide repeat-containing protein At4g02750 [Zea mays]
MPLGLGRIASYCTHRSGPSRSSLPCMSGACDAITSANRLIGKHLRAGRVDAVREVFDKMPQRDIVSWNSLMAVYARSGVHDSAVTAFLKMRREGFCADHTSFSTVLSACARMETLALGRCIHGLATKTRSSLNVFVGSSLITMYANCGVYSCLEWIVDDVDSPNLALWNALISGLVVNHRVEDARRVFDQMPEHNVVSWTVMIKGYFTVHEVGRALELFNLMPTKNSVSWCVMIGGLVNHKRFREVNELFNTLMSCREIVTNAILVKIVNACAGLKSIGGGRCVHGFAVKSGFIHDHIIEASLVVMYCNSLDIDEAQLEFCKMERKHVGSCNAIISGCIHAGKIDEARKIFYSMDGRDKISWNLMVDGYVKHGKIHDAIELYSKMPEKNLEASTTLMSCFIDNGMLDKARDVFYSMPQVDVVSCTTLLFGYVKGGYIYDALDLFCRMHKRTVVTYNVMIAGLLHQGKVTEAYKLFDESPTRDLVTWSCLINGLAQNGLNNDAIKLYKKMLLSNIRPSDSILSSLISCFSHHSMIVHGQQFHASTIRLGFGSHLLIQNALISIYCKCGEMIIAQAIFDRMDNRDTVTWNTMICGYAFNSFGQNAIETFDNMKKAQVDPDEITFLGILTACNHMRLLEEGKHFFNMMTCNYGILPNKMHYACMVDLFGRTGMLEQAEELMKSMPFKPDFAIWTSLLSSCRLNGNDRLAEHAASQLISIKPTIKMPYLHLIRVNGSTKRWNVMENLRNQIRNAATDKEVGYSWS